MIQKSHGNSGAEDRFIDLFCDTFGAEKGQYVYLQYPIVDIYGNHRFIDFALNFPDGKVAIEVDGNTWQKSPGSEVTLAANQTEQMWNDDVTPRGTMLRLHVASGTGTVTTVKLLSNG